ETGSFVVNNGSVTINVPFTPKTWLVTFSEHHLPVGTNWSLRINGGPSHSSTTGNIWVQEKNGTYNFVLGSVSGWNSTTERGTFTVTGGGVFVSISFSQVVYKVTFSETGLPNGHSWQVTMRAATHIGPGPTLTFESPNGTFAFSASSTGYTATPGSGNVVVNGAPTTQAISFA
ncbi:MAG TPA: hypothetical protein VGP88_04335, partial [Thermoplasmata archaeon]|nr:hypothetical protein [Thermoplasmata archaeon]